MGDERAKKLEYSGAPSWPVRWALRPAFSLPTKSTANYWDVDEAETWEPAAYDEKWPKGEYFIIDVQAHFTNGFAIPGFRRWNS